MTPTTPEMIAAVIKEGRIAKGYTQKELAEISNISIRSIQRIENAVLQPRAYTLKVLAQVLDISFKEENIPELPKEKTVETRDKTQRIIFSVGVSLVSLVLFWAFLAQSTFPETTFEFLMATAAFLSVLTIVLWLIWRPKNI
ncbi:MAG: XRE family transcriptional regulator [Sphingobacteriales bacterium]|nr:MAG: XRE family transcriptional regulator [Sphingobacteriales bacterium]